MVLINSWFTSSSGLIIFWGLVYIWGLCIFWGSGLFGFGSDSYFLLLGCFFYFLGFLFFGFFDGFWWFFGFFYDFFLLGFNGFYSPKWVQFLKFSCNSFKMDYTSRRGGGDP